MHAHGHGAAGGEALRRLEVAVAKKSGSTLVGKVELTEVDEGVRIVVRVAGAEPGLHAVHVHENPDCSAPDASSAGDHYNPDNHQHGIPPNTPRHFGDLGNMETKTPNGEGLLEIVVPGANLDAEGKHSLLNRSLIIHAKEDTGAQPAGDAGGRIGCAELTHAAAEGDGVARTATE